MIKAVLFDLDGTLLDTEESILGAFEYAFKTQTIAQPARENIVSLVGRPLREMYEALAPAANIEPLLNAHHDFQINNLHLVKAFPGVTETLATLRKAGLKIAIVTARYGITCSVYLDVTNLTNTFDVIITGDDVKKEKPDPEPVLKALAAFNVQPEEALMVGDTFADIGAGKNAGVKTVGALYGHMGEKIRDLRPDYLISSIEEILSIVF